MKCFKWFNEKYNLIFILRNLMFLWLLLFQLFLRLLQLKFTWTQRIIIIYLFIKNMMQLYLNSTSTVTFAIFLIIDNESVLRCSNDWQVIKLIKMSLIVDVTKNRDLKKRKWFWHKICHVRMLLSDVCSSNKTQLRCNHCDCEIIQTQRKKI